MSKRRYNDSYMEDHCIDWFFQINGIPYYVYSRGLPIPHEIKVSDNRRLQHVLYDDVTRDLEENYNGDLYIREFMRCINSDKNEAQISLPGVNDLEYFKYVAYNNALFHTSAIKFILFNDFNINEIDMSSPDTKHIKYLVGVMTSYITMLRRGFKCLYQYADSNGQIRYKLIAEPDTSTNEGSNSLANLLCKHNLIISLPQLKDKMDQNDYDILFFSKELKNYNIAA